MHQKQLQTLLPCQKMANSDGIIFHCIIPEFMIRRPTGTGGWGQSIYGDSFEDEFSEELYNVRGALQWLMLDQIQMAVSSLSFKTAKFLCSKELERGGWPKLIADPYATNGGTPHLTVAIPYLAKRTTIHTKF